MKDGDVVIASIDIPRANGQHFCRSLGASANPP